MNTMSDENSETPKVKLDHKTVREMQEAGIERPEDVAISSWRQTEIDFNKPKYQTIAYLAALGHSQKDIAEQLGMSAGNLSVILASDRMKFEVKRINHRLFGKDITKRLKELLPEALDAVETVMRDPVAKPQTKLTAAIDIMDRAMGKPKQTVELETSAIRELFERLDQKRDAGRTITVSPDAPKFVGEGDGQVQNIEPTSKPLDAADEWVKNNL